MAGYKNEIHSYRKGPTTIVWRGIKIKFIPIEKDPPLLCGGVKKFIPIEKNAPISCGGVKNEIHSYKKDHH